MVFNSLETVCGADADAVGSSSNKPSKKYHIKARGPSYPKAPGNIKKFTFEDAKVSWDVEYDDYKPVKYTAEAVLKKPVWADPDVE